MAKEVRKTIGIFVNGKEVENSLKSIKSAITKVTNELSKMTVGTDEYNKKSKDLLTLKKIYSEYREELTLTNKEIEDGTNILNRKIIKWGAVGSAISGVTIALQNFISKTQQYVDAYAAIDDAMTNVSKYTGLTREEVKQLNEEFKKIDTRTPTEKLNALAADAGRLGITSKEAVKDFVEAADIINTALGEDLGEDAVKNIGKMAQMFGESETMGLRGAMIATASAVNSLGQSSSASEPYIVEFTSRLAGVANTAGITQANIMGIASTMDQNMGQVEKSATAVQKVMMDMMSKTGKYAELVGMTSEEFKKLVDSDMNAAFLSVLDALNRISSQGGSALAETLSNLKLTGAGVQETLMSLANNTDRLREAQMLATQAYSDGNSVIKEAEAVNGNAAAQLEIAKKRMQDARAELGEKLIPIVTRLYDILGTTSGFLTKNMAVVKAFLPIVGAYVSIMGLALVKEKGLLAINKAKVALIALQKKGMASLNLVTASYNLLIAKQTGNTVKAAAAQQALNAAMKANPFGLILSIVALASAAISRFRKNTEDATNSLKDLKVTINQQYNEESFEIEKLRKLIDDENVSREEKLKAINRLKEIIPEYTAELSKEGIVTDQNTQAIDDYLSRLHDKIELEATEAKLKELYNDKADKRAEYEQKRDNFLNSSLWFGYRKRRKESEEAAKAYEEAADAYDNMKDSYDEMMKRQIASGNSVVTNNTNGNGNVTNTNNSGGPNTTSSSTKTDPIADFEKKLADFRKRQQNASLEGWAKTKQGIIDSYQEMIDEANRLGKNDVAEQLTQEKDSAIAAAGEKYMNKMTNMLVEFVKQAETLKADGGEESELSRIIIGTNEEWQEKIKTLNENITTVKNFLSDLPEGNENRAVVQTALAQMSQQLINSELEQAKAVSNAIKEYTKSTDDFIKNEQKRAAEATMTEKEREIAAINERYDVEIERLNKIIDKRASANAEDPELPSLMEKLELLKKMKDAAVTRVGGGRSVGNSVWEQLANFDWSNLSGNWQGCLQLMTGALQEFSSAAVDIFDSINQARTNRECAEFNEFVSIQDEKAQKLKDRLEKGLISQEEYDKQMAKMDEDRDAREKALNHEQFEREKRADIVKATITGIMAAMQSFLNGGGFPWGLIPMALSIATTAAQIGVIASQVNPYARGGYVNGAQVILAGEAGDEWIASSRLLKDRKTAPVIAALQEYQEGNRRALDMLPLSVPNWKKLSQAGKNISRTFATSPSVNNYYTNSNNTTTNHTTSDNGELLAELRMMNNFLKDPKNRQAVISRKMQLEFDRQEAEIKNMARL